MDGFDKKYYTPKDIHINNVIIDNNDYNNIQGTIRNGDLKVIGDMIKNPNLLTVDKKGYITIYTNNPAFTIKGKKIIKVEIIFTITDENSGNSDKGKIEFEVENMLIPVTKNFIVPTPYSTGLIINFGEKLYDLVEMDGFDKNYYTPKDFHIDKVIIDNNDYNNIQGTIRNGNLSVIGDNDSNNPYILTVDQNGYITIYTNNPAFTRDDRKKIITANVIFSVTDKKSGESDTGKIEFNVDNRPKTVIKENFLTKIKKFIIAFYKKYWFFK